MWKRNCRPTAPSLCVVEHLRETGGRCKKLVSRVPWKQRRQFEPVTYMSSRCQVANTLTFVVNGQSRIGPGVVRCMGDSSDP